MKKTVVLASLVALAIGSMVACSAATSIYGTSGLIETPDDAIAQVATPQLGGMYVSNLGNTDYNATTFSGVIGITPKFEVGATVIDSNAPGVDSKSFVNAKYSLVSESLVSPSITVGVVDLGNNLDQLNAGIDKASAFIVVGKNLTSVAENVAGSVVKPVKGSIGLGTGLYRGGFAGLSITAAPNFDLMFEYLAKGLRQNGTFNAGIRFTPGNGLSVSAGALDFEDLYASVTYSVTRY